MSQNLKQNQPFMQIVKGNPSAVEVAALTALFNSLAAAAIENEFRLTHRNQWGSNSSSYSPMSFQNVDFY